MNFPVQDHQIQIWKSKIHIWVWYFCVCSKIQGQVLMDIPKLTKLYGWNSSTMEGVKVMTNSSGDWSHSIA